MISAALFSLLAVSAAATLTLKESVTLGKNSACLADVVVTEKINPRDQEKLSRYCRIELKSSTTSLSAKEIELHAWAAGVIPEKISGSRVVITRVAATEIDAPKSVNTTQKLRRGATVKLVMKSANMQIARNAVVLMDAFPGETVDVRLSGTRKNLRAKLVSSEMAEVIQ